MENININDNTNEIESKIKGEFENIMGRNSVLEAINSDRNIDTVFISKSENKKGLINKIVAIAVSKGIVVKKVDDGKLNNLSDGGNHQGVVAVVCAAKYSDLEDILHTAKEREEQPLIIMCDEIEDQHNLGAIIRTAECCGAHGVIIPKRRSASLSPIIYKTSVGAVEHIHVVRVSNLSSTREVLKKSGVWIYGADQKGEIYSNVDFKGAMCIIIGSEDKGISRIVLEKCDFKISIPMKGKIQSLNASVAAGVLMCDVVRQRG